MKSGQGDCRLILKGARPRNGEDELMTLRLECRSLDLTASMQAEDLEPVAPGARPATEIRDLDFLLEMEDPRRSWRGQIPVKFIRFRERVIGILAD